MINRYLTLPKEKSFFLFGPRQSGKTMLIESLIDNRNTFSLNLLLTREYSRLLADPSLFENELNTAIQSGKKTIFIDEIQRIPELLNVIHAYMEKNKDIQFILTGSSVRKLKRMNANLLGGRALTCKLYPFSHAEIKDCFTSLRDILEFGLIPPVYLSCDREGKKDILRSYVDTFIKEEIEAEAKIRKLDSFFRFLQVAGNENGNPLNFSRIGRDVGVSYNTVKDHFQLLDDCLIGFFLHPFVRSKRKRLSRHPKFYFFDPGVVRTLTRRLNTELTRLDQDYGRLFEHLVILEIVKLNSYRKLDLEFSYYRTESGVEVDMIIELPDRPPIACEIKSTDRPSAGHFSGLESFRHDHPGARCYLVADVPRPSEEQGIRIIPWTDLEEMLLSVPG